MENQCNEEVLSHKGKIITSTHEHPVADNDRASSLDYLHSLAQQDVLIRRLSAIDSTWRRRSSARSLKDTNIMGRLTRSGPTSSTASILALVAYSLILA